jgi:hypothetical protein
MLNSTYTERQGAEPSKAEEVECKLPFHLCESDVIINTGPTDFSSDDGFS